MNKTLSTFLITLIAGMLASAAARAGSATNLPPENPIGNALIDTGSFKAIRAEGRPLPDELKALLNETAPKTLQILYSKIHPDVQLAGMEVLDVGSSGWKYSLDSTNETAYWPVRIKCTFTFADEKGNTATQKMGILYHVTRDKGGRCQAEFSDIFTVRTAEEWAEKLKQDRDAMQQMQNARRNSLQIACINNLRQLDAAKAQWALEKGKTSADTPTVDDLKPYLSRGKMVVCPAGGDYSIGRLDTAPTCSVKGHVLP
jgi:hypothetical protein